MRADSLRRHPSPALGLRLAMALWRVVLGVWIVNVLALLPAVTMIDVAVSSALAELPDGGAAAGDVTLVVFEAIRPVAAPVAVAFGVGVLLIWQWGVVWRAGVVSWQLWAGGGPASFSGIVGLGLAWWWRYLRLSLAAVTVTGAACVALWIPLVLGAGAADARMAEGLEMLIVAMGCALSFALWTAAWASTLRAAWLFGRPDRRSALVAWMRGFFETMSSPVRSFGVFALWTVPLAVLIALPLCFGGAVPALRSGLAGQLVLHTTAIAAAFCKVALLCSYAPASGLITLDDEDDKNHYLKSVRPRGVR